jgi:hypothetical protein
MAADGTLRKRWKWRDAITGGRRPYAALAMFLNRYLSEAALAQSGSVEDAARAFASAARPGQLDRVARQLTRFHERAVEMEEAEWRAALASLGGAWQPSSVDALSGIASLLLDRVPPRYQI